MKNILYLRGTIDWSKCNIDNYATMNAKSARYLKSDGKADSPTEYLEKIHLWNSVFRMNYFQFRNKLNQIQKQNISEIKGLDHIIDYFDMSLLDSLDDYILLCVDDDDWFHPDIFNVLNNLPPTWDGVAWSMAWIGFVYWNNSSEKIQLNTDVPHSSFKTFTNNFAFKKSGYQKCKHIKEMLENHWFVNNSCYKTEGFNYKPVDDFLSVAVKSPASITSLLKIESKEKMLEIANQIMPSSVPPQINWCKKYYDEYLNTLGGLLGKIYL